MIFCEVCGTPVTWVRASDRSLTMGPLPSTGPGSVMLCLVDPWVEERKFTGATQQDASMSTSQEKRIYFFMGGIIIPVKRISVAS